MFKLFKKKQQIINKDCPTCHIDHSVYPDYTNSQDEWNQREPLLGAERPVVLGKLFSIHEPFPHTEQTLIEGTHRKETIKIAHRQFQEIQNNHLPFSIR